MGLAEAKKYLNELHKKQDNPFLWPDFLTGLPDKAAIIKKVDEVFPRLGVYSIAYVRIANVHPYLIKYGPDSHAEIIQWAAAILKTSSGKCKDLFVGTLSTHDFIVTCETDKMERTLTEACRIFNKRMEQFYSDEDLAKGTTLSFIRGGEKVHVGLVKLIAVIADAKLKTAKSRIIQDMGKVCESLEMTGDDMIRMSSELICRKS